MTSKKRPWDDKRTQASTKAIKEKVAKHKAQQEEHTKQLKQMGRPNKYRSAVLFAYRLADYFRNCDNTQDPDGRAMPYTLTGLQLAVQCDSHMFHRYKTGEHDKVNDEHTLLADNGLYIETNIYDTEQEQIEHYKSDIELQPYFDRLYSNDSYDDIHFSRIVEKARTIVKEQAEQRLYIKGRVADIFTMKAQHGWQEENVTTHRLEIATSEEARQALEELKLIE